MLCTHAMFGSCTYGCGAHMGSSRSNDRDRTCVFRSRPSFVVPSYNMSSPQDGDLPTQGVGEIPVDVTMPTAVQQQLGTVADSAKTEPEQEVDPASACPFKTTRSEDGKGGWAPAGGSAASDAVQAPTTGGSAAAAAIAKAKAEPGVGIAKKVNHFTKLHPVIFFSRVREPPPPLFFWVNFLPLYMS